MTWIIPIGSALASNYRYMSIRKMLNHLLSRWYDFILKIILYIKLIENTYFQLLRIIYILIIYHEPYICYICYWALSFFVFYGLLLGFVKGCWLNGWVFWVCWMDDWRFCWPHWELGGGFCWPHWGFGGGFCCPHDSCGWLFMLFWIGAPHCNPLSNTLYTDWCDCCGIFSELV